MKKVIVFITFISCVLSLVAQEQKVGEVTAIENGKIYISSGEGQVKEGDRFNIVTNNEYFTHPVTGELIPKNDNINAIIEIESVFKDYSQAKPIDNSSIANIKVGMPIVLMNKVGNEISPNIDDTTFNDYQQEDINSEEEKYLKTMVEATNMNCPQKFSKHHSLDKVELTEKAMIHYYTYSNKYYKVFSREMIIKKSVKDLTKSYRKEMKKDRGASLKKTLTALLKTNRYIEHVYYNQDHTEHFSYRIYMNDIFQEK